MTARCVSVAFAVVAEANNSPEADTVVAVAVVDGLTMASGFGDMVGGTGCVGMGRCIVD